MFLKRVQVPDFRVLKNVDISFEPQFRPRVFPLGSQNGGGKSTLLQLIFVLLNCSGNVECVSLIKHLLEGFEIPPSERSRRLANIEIVLNNAKTVALDFILYRNEVIEQEFQERGEFESLKFAEEALPLLEEAERNNLLVQHGIDKAKHYQDAIFSFLINENLYLIFGLPLAATYPPEDYSLICSSNDVPASQLHGILCEISEHIFLAAPSTQVFLFLPPEHKKRLFTKSLDLKSENYYAALRRLMAKTPNLFTYDFSLVDLLLDAFRKARDSDFQQKTESGHYGNAYDVLLNKVNALLGVKQVNVLGDLSGIRFSMEQDGQKVDLLPEDLSHGELKRLSIYMWLEHLQIKDAIVLMDEIEIALHPDWQYHIVGDLVEWEPTNQYILATHSYELCRALPPAHVKDIEPNFLPQPQSV
jgi:AAA domain, putative AbiEii toxin, Type IV TA system